MNTARYNAGGFGTQTAGLAAGGYDSTDRTNNSEEYNGTSWTEGNNLNNVGEGGASAGTQTNAAYMGRGAPPATNKFEGYDGTSWTNLTNLPHNLWYGGGAGAGYTSCLVFGGSSPPVVANTDYWNGSSWTELASLNTARATIGGAGSSYDAALAYGGEPGSGVLVESFNGTAWTEVGDMVSDTDVQSSGGTQTDAFAYGPGAVNMTQHWDGTSWKTAPNLARSAIGRSGTANTPATTNMIFGGYHPPGTTYSGATEEFTAESSTTATAKTIDFD